MTIKEYQSKLERIGKRLMIGTFITWIVIGIFVTKYNSDGLSFDVSTLTIILAAILYILTSESILLQQNSAWDKGGDLFGESVESLGNGLIITVVGFFIGFILKVLGLISMTGVWIVAAILVVVGICTGHYQFNKFIRDKAPE